uniref:Uncharacterized protein n=1 Tax=Rhizophora mucronata TaxID=61149 RepID=A0A2P2MFA6_RHIMU
MEKIETISSKLEIYNHHRCEDGWLCSPVETSFPNTNEFGGL